MSWGCKTPGSAWTRSLDAVARIPLKGTGPGRRRPRPTTPRPDHSLVRRGKPLVSRTPRIPLKGQASAADAHGEPLSSRLRRTSGTESWITHDDVTIVSSRRLYGAPHRGTAEFWRQEPSFTKAIVGRALSSFSDIVAITFRPQFKTTPAVPAFH